MPARIIFPEKGRVALESFDPGVPGDDEIRVRTMYSLMSIGTETIILHQRYDPDTHFAKMFSFPQLQTGVQAIGEVEEVGIGVDEFVAGDVVYMRMAHGSHQVQRSSECSPVPGGLDLKSACWCGLAKTAFRAAWAGQFDKGGSVLVIGAGPVGQMVLRWASAAGMTTIGVADVSSDRLEYAVRGGATQVFESDVSSSMEKIRSVGGGEGFPLVVDTTGNAAVFASALAAAGRFAKVVLLGDSGYPSRQCLTSDAMQKGLTIQVTHDSHDVDGWTQRRIDERFFEAVGAGRFPLEGLITHEFNPEDCVEAYELASEHRDQAMGILYDWTGGDW